MNNNRLLVFTTIIFIFKIIHAFYYLDMKTIQDSDAAEYIFFAKEFSELRFFSYWNVEEHYLEVGLYLPILLSIFLLFFNSVIPFLVYNCILSALMVIIVFKISNKIFKKRYNQYFTLIALLWTSLNPDYYRFNYQILKEPSLYFFILIFLHSIVRYYYDSKFKYINFLYILFSYSLLFHCDPRYLFIFPLVILFFIIKYKISYCFLKKTFSFSVLLIIILLPSSIYYYILYKEVILLSPQTITITSKFWDSNLSNYKKEFNKRFQDLAISKYTETSEFSSEELYYQERHRLVSDELSVHNIKPCRYTRTEMYIYSFIHYWQPLFINYNFLYDGYRIQKWSFRHNLSSFIFYGIFLPFYLLSLFIFIKNKNYFIAFLFFIPIYHCLMHVYVCLSLERYRSHINIIVLLISLWAIQSIFNKYKYKN